MLDFSAILTASGLLLWQYNFTEEADVLSGISSDVFAGDGTSIEVAGSRIQWVRDPTGRLIFLVRQLGFSRTSADAERQVGTPRVLESPRTYDLLRAMRRDFMAIQDSNVTSVIDATSGAPVSHLSRPRHLIRQDWLPLFRSWEPTFLSLAAHYSDSKLLPSRPPSACDEAVITANGSWGVVQEPQHTRHDARHRERCIKLHSDRRYDDRPQYRGASQPTRATPTTGVPEQRCHIETVRENKELSVSWLTPAIVDPQRLIGRTRVNGTDRIPDQPATSISAPLFLLQAMTPL
jgi:hypothetical protein